jgi:hypothetical protein
MGLYQLSMQSTKVKNNLALDLDAKNDQLKTNESINDGLQTDKENSAKEI